MSSSTLGRPTPETSYGSDAGVSPVLSPVLSPALSPVVGHLIVGPQEHGVVAFALGLARHLGGPMMRMSQWRAAQQGPLRALAYASDVVHLQFTDALYADRCDRAADRFVALRAGVPGPVSVTLHDLPDPHDSPDRYRRRRDAYRRVVSAVDAVVVSSRHEADLLEQVLGHPVPAGVVPLPVEHPWPVLAPLGSARTGSARTGSAQVSGVRYRPNEVGLLGFVHPGKGYAEALSELAAVPRPLTVTALGRAATGQQDLLPVLGALSAEAGHRWQVTGFIAESLLLGRLHEVAVPLAPNRQVSASGSVNTWIAAGRRPLVADGGYARETAARMPGAIRLYRRGELAAAVAEALAEPASTWLGAARPAGLDGAGAAKAYRDLLAATC